MLLVHEKFRRVADRNIESPERACSSSDLLVNHGSF